jgi:hypothetical protein
MKKRNTFQMAVADLLNKILKLFFEQRALHVIGDSHADAFRFVDARYIWLKTNFKFCIVHGASALGLANPRSKTNAMNVFSSYIENIEKNSSVLFCLGEVDCGFVIWYRALKYNMSIEEQFELSLNNYQNLILRTAKYTKSVLVMSTPLPTIFDGKEWGDVAHARTEVKTPIRQRMDLTLRYNAALKIFCSQNQFEYVDVQKYTLDPESHLINTYYLNSNPSDHHLDTEKIAPVLQAELKSFNFN